MKRNVIILASLILSASLVSCKKDSAPSQDLKPAVTPAGNTDGTLVTQTIGPSGGTVISDDKEMELVIPAGALAANTNITIQPVTNNAPNGRRKGYRCLPDGLKFAKNITLKFHYTEEDAAATKPEYMMIAFQNADRKWQVIENVNNDVVNNVVSASVNHFTDFSGFDVMRIEPPSLYLKKGETGEYAISVTGMSQLDGVLLLSELLEKPETWKANGITGGNGTYGTIKANADQTKGVYKAPAAIPVTNPVIITAEINFPFRINGQQFNKGILTANAYIVGGSYAVAIESTLDLTLGTGEKFRMRDQARFTVNLMGITGNISHIQNSPASYQKTQESPYGCVSTIEVAGTGIINIRPEDLLQVMVNPMDKEVIISFGMGGGFVNPQIRTSCPGVTPGVNEIPLGNIGGGDVTFYDSGQPQVKEIGVSPYSIKYTITPLN